ncbi:MAG: type II toxin-antitoxin system prevent-host-death family antitoxin [Actinomycetota bacterium]
MAKRHVEVVNVRELSRQTSRVLDQVEGGGVVLVTKNGRPVATVTPISAEALEDFVLAQAPMFVEAMDEAERDLEAGNTTNLDALIDEFSSDQTATD